MGKTHLWQSRFTHVPRGAELPDLVEYPSQLGQRFQQNGYKTCSLGATCCSDCETEAFLWFTGCGEDACFQCEEVQGLG